MIKLLELWTRRPDMTHEQAVRHWTEVHAPLVKKTFGGLDEAASSNAISDAAQTRDAPFLRLVSVRIPVP